MDDFTDIPRSLFSHSYHVLSVDSLHAHVHSVVTTYLSTFSTCRSLLLNTCVFSELVYEFLEEHETLSRLVFLRRRNQKGPNRELNPGPRASGHLECRDETRSAYHTTRPLGHECVSHHTNHGVTQTVLASWRGNVKNSLLRSLRIERYEG